MAITHLSHPHLSLFLSVLQIALVSSLHPFSPPNNYLINCGSPTDTIADGRSFIGELSPSGTSYLSSILDSSIHRGDPSLHPSPLYHTARVFSRPSRYGFRVRERGTHIVRLHFHEFLAPGRARFHVLVNRVLVLNNFTGENLRNPRIKEFMIWVDEGRVDINFVPVGKSKLAFISAIEVITAPKDLIGDTAQVVLAGDVKKMEGLERQALETIYRVSVGGPKVTPFNDSLWRTWAPDDEYLLSDTTSSSSRVYFSGRIKYRRGGASREVCPDNVYNTARVLSSKAEQKSVVGWAFPVARGYRYLVRMHFCDISSVSLGLLVFNVYVNKHLAYEDLDLSYLTDNVLASPFYTDFVVEDGGDILTVSVGASKKSSPYGAAHGILNAIEIMKLNNSMGSLDGYVSADYVLKKSCYVLGSGGGALVTTIAAMCLLLAAASVVVRRRLFGVKDEVAWSPLPVDVVSPVHNKCNTSTKGIR